MIESPIRYAGGKKWLVSSLCKEIEEVKPTYYIEPFVGGGSIALNIPSYIRKILSDANPIVMDMWMCLRDLHEPLINELDALVKRYGNTQESYLKARQVMNGMIGNPRQKWVSRAALFLYLNARSFNGLWRTNGSGLYNVPFGKIEKPASIDLEEARIISNALRGSMLFVNDYKLVLKKHEFMLAKSAIYADPPYDGTYEGYTKDGFGETDQRELSEWLRWCAQRGAKVWSTNADTPLIREIYSWAKISSMEEWHGIGATGARRGNKACVLIRGGL